MRELNTVQLRTSPFHTRVRRTFAEIHMIFTWETFQIFVCENQWLIDKTVDHQTVVFFCQFNRTRVVTFECTALWCDRAIQRVNGCKVD